MGQIDRSRKNVLGKEDRDLGPAGSRGQQNTFFFLDSLVPGIVRVHNKAVFRHVLGNPGFIPVDGIHVRKGAAGR